MKIAQVVGRYHPYIGGVETHVREICERLSEKNCELEVLTTDPSGKLPEKEFVSGVEIKRFKSWAPYESYYFSHQLKKYLAKNSGSFDIVHAHGYAAFPALYAEQTKGKNKLVFTPHYHGTGHTMFRRLLHMPYKILAKKIFEKADQVICVSCFERDLVANDFAVTADKVAVIPNGVNFEEFKHLGKTKQKNRTILYVGRLEEYKGVQHLIRVLPMLADDVILETVGKGPYKESLIKLAKKLGVNHRVTFFQNLPRTELLRKYANADVFVLLSRHEAYGISVAEALCAKTPCIVAETSALQEWVDANNCFGVDYPIDLNELVNLLDNVMSKDVEGLRIPDWNEITGRLIDLYENLHDS